MTLPSTATETIANLWWGFDSCSSPGRWNVDIFPEGSEVPTGLGTAAFQPDADLVNSSNLWQRDTGATTGLWQSIVLPGVNPASYVTYQGTFGATNLYAFNVDTAAWPAGRRVLKVEMSFAGAATNGSVGRLQVVYRDSGVSYPLRNVTLTSQPETFTVEMGELNPATGRPWTESEIEDFATTSGFGWKAISGRTAEMQIYTATVTFTYVTENRVAAGVLQTITTLQAPEWQTVALFNPNTGASNWSKANATDYTLLVRSLSGDGSIPGLLTPGQGTIRTLDSGEPLPTGSLSYRPLIDASGIVVDMGDTVTAAPAIALDVNASATDSADGQPYIKRSDLDVGDPGNPNNSYQEVNGATATTYELLEVAAAVAADADDSSVVEWNIVNPTGPVTLASGSITAADVRAGEPLGDVADASVFKVTVPIAVTLAAATTYRVGMGGTANEVGVSVLSTADNATGSHGTPATYGGSTLDWFVSPATDLPVTLSTVPAPVTGFQTWQEQWDTEQSGCNPAQVPYTILRWTASTLAATFGYYQIERSIEDGDWQQVAQITSEGVDLYEDKEAPFGAEVTYRIRVVRAGDLIPSEWTEVEAQVLVAPECVYYFSSNVYADILAYNAGDRTTWQFPSSDEVLIARRAGANYQQALVASEWLGDVFELDLTTWLPPTSEASVRPGRATFDPILTMTRTALPYICVRDWRGRVWYANVNVAEGRDDNSAASPHDIASTIITEITATPAIVDVEDNPLMYTVGWWSAEEPNG